MPFYSDRQNRILLLTAMIIGLIPWGRALAQSDLQSFKVVVNSDRDTINPDSELTLREAISLANNTLPYSNLSPAEQQQVKKIASNTQIEFDLFAENAVIKLQDTLPPLVAPGLVIDGTSHPDYDSNDTATVEIPIPIPVVSLTAAEGKNIFRGLTIAGDRITVKGLSIYGFGHPGSTTNTTPSADIVISSSLPVAHEELQPYVSADPPQDVAIIDNWLGLPPDESLTTIPSSFGVWLFDGVNTKIQRNRIYHHGGSAILTSKQARKTQILENIIVGNGLRGMPHAIYLEGQIDDTAIADNLLCANDGSGIYLFKPEGKITVKNNAIKYNGRRVPSAAVYLIGNDHQILNNQIIGQTGTGVTVAAYPQSIRNIITNNSFDDLAGLSIDLNTRNHTGKPFFKLGDGVNPPRNSPNRKKDTANRAINAPQFLSEDFFIIDGRVSIDGVADPYTKITLYRVEPNILNSEVPLASYSENHGPLSTPLFDTVTDAEGRFRFTSDDLEPGVVSAIATRPDYGTSEPAFNAVIKSLEGSETTSVPTITIPNCTTKPVARVSDPPVELETEPPEADTVTVSVPTNIHFALDKSDIYPKSADVLNRIAGVLKQHSFLTIEIQGHTDIRASDQYNLTLSKKRAIAARNYLMQQGVEPERMTILPLGESKLKQPGNTSLEHAYNRRVEINFQDLRGIEIIFEEQDSDLQVEK